MYIPIDISTSLRKKLIELCMFTISLESDEELAPTGTSDNKTHVPSTGETEDKEPLEFASSPCVSSWPLDFHIEIYSGTCKMCNMYSRFDDFSICCALIF